MKRKASAHNRKPWHGPSSGFTLLPVSTQGPGRLSRRELFSRLFSPVKAVASALPEKDAGRPSAPAAKSPLESIAVISGRHCVAYQGESCTRCLERCPIPGAIIHEHQLPRVEPDLCTGCGLCLEVCPVKEDAIRLVPRPPGLTKPNPQVGEILSPFPELPADPDSL